MLTVFIYFNSKSIIRQSRVCYLHTTHLRSFERMFSHRHFAASYESVSDWWKNGSPKCHEVLIYDPPLIQKQRARNGKLIIQNGALIWYNLFFRLFYILLSTRRCRVIYNVNLMLHFGIKVQVWHSFKAILCIYLKLQISKMYL